MHILETDALFGYACAVLRPAWNGDPVSSLAEIFDLATSPASLAFIALTAVALWHRNFWTTMLLCLLWIGWATHILISEFTYEPLMTAQKIGCIGSSIPYLILGSMICVATLGVTRAFKGN